MRETWSGKKPLMGDEGNEIVESSGEKKLKTEREGGNRSKSSVTEDEEKTLKESPVVPGLKRKHVSVKGGPTRE